ncbi:SRPBCC family protein [Mycobacterium vicinigordonae]|uniref:SRPBCC family protein n=1 Tax=Mycobacterium vicinigordonae TaxID=1719132 RepID=A0A7D6IU47_9MYCO|nr:SRPBCC family protein [Mycobacterium vicinigordonae]QLL08899.1 SRPBCC family protein [Mycobacterium vicinigordonae]
MSVSKRLESSAASVWAVLADFGSVEWIPGLKEVQVEGRGPGMCRRIKGSGDTPIVETLLWIKPEARTLAYEITDNPLPVSRFVAVASVSESGIGDPSGGSTVVWEIDYEPDGDDAVAREAIEAVYGMMADWIDDYTRLQSKR